MQGPPGEQVPSRLRGMYCPEDLDFATPVRLLKPQSTFSSPFPVTRSLISWSPFRGHTCSVRDMFWR